MGPDGCLTIQTIVHVTWSYKQYSCRAHVAHVQHLLLPHIIDRYHALKCKRCQTCDLCLQW